LNPSRPGSPRRGRAIIEVGIDHFLHEGVERNLRLPTELCACQGGITQQRLDFSWPEITRVDSHDHPSGRYVDALLVQARAFSIPTAFPGQGAPRASRIHARNVGFPRQ